MPASRLGGHQTHVHRPGNAGLSLVPFTAILKSAGERKANVTSTQVDSLDPCSHASFVNIIAAGAGICPYLCASRVCALYVCAQQFFGMQITCSIENRLHQSSLARPPSNTLLSCREHTSVVFLQAQLLNWGAKQPSAIHCEPGMASTCY